MVEPRIAVVVAVLVLGTVGGPIPGGSAVRSDVAVFVAVVALGIGALTSLVACLPALAARVIAFRRVGAVLAHVVRAATAEALSHGRLAGVGRDLIGARGRQLTKEGEREEDLEYIKQSFGQRFGIKDVDPRYFLGCLMEIEDKGEYKTLTITQPDFVEDLLLK